MQNTIMTAWGIKKNKIYMEIKKGKGTLRKIT